MELNTNNIARLLSPKQMYMLVNRRSSKHFPFRVFEKKNVPLVNFAIIINSKRKVPRNWWIKLPCKNFNRLIAPRRQEHEGN